MSDSILKYKKDLEISNSKCLFNAILDESGILKGYKVEQQSLEGAFEKIAEDLKLKKTPN
jgi:hypothetical protein